MGPPPAGPRLEAAELSSKERDLGSTGTQPETEGPRGQSPPGSRGPACREAQSSRREHAHGPGQLRAHGQGLPNVPVSGDEQEAPSPDEDPQTSTGSGSALWPQGGSALRSMATGIADTADLEPTRKLF